jgi:hypothetical protein
MQDSKRRPAIHGVYGIAVYDLLGAAGLEVYLVNARDTKNLAKAKRRREPFRFLAPALSG